MSDFTIRTISDPAKARAIFERLSPADSLFDTWQLREAFWQPFQFPLHFILAEQSGQPAALLPLQLNTNSGNYEFFGGGWMEDNRLYFTESGAAAVPQLIAAIPQPADLEYLAWQPETADFLQPLVLDAVPELAKYAAATEPETGAKYSAELAGLADEHAFIDQHFTAKSRANFNKKIRQLQTEHLLAIEPGMSADLDILAEFNKKTFGDLSGFYRPHRLEIFRRLASEFPVFQPQIIRFLVDGRLAGVSFGLVYRETWYYLNAGSDNAAVPNLGTAIVLENIRQAIALGLVRFDALANNYNWKERWHLQKIPQYRLISPDHV